VSDEHAVALIQQELAGRDRAAYVVFDDENAGMLHRAGVGRHETPGDHKIGTIWPARSRERNIGADGADIPQGGMRDANADRRMNHTDREAIQESARRARESAHALAARALLIRSNASDQKMRAEELVAASMAIRDKLRAAVTEHARFMRQLGQTPELVVITVKELADAAAREVQAVTDTSDWRIARQLREDLVRWTIDAYYGAA
jgi:hypothetical protein